MNAALLDLVEREMVEPQEANFKTVDKAGFTAMLKARGFPTTVGE